MPSRMSCFWSKFRFHGNTKLKNSTNEYVWVKYSGTTYRSVTGVSIVQGEIIMKHKLYFKSTTPTLNQWWPEFTDNKYVYLCCFVLDLVIKQHKTKFVQFVYIFHVHVYMLFMYQVHVYCSLLFNAFSL